MNNLSSLFRLGNTGRTMTNMDATSMDLRNSQNRLVNTTTSNKLQTGGPASCTNAQLQLGFEAPGTSLGRGAASLGTGTASLGTGTASLGSGAASLGIGTASLGTGTASLGTGTASLGTGAASLGTGTASLGTGAAGAMGTTLQGGNLGMGSCSQARLSGGTSGSAPSIQ